MNFDSVMGIWFSNVDISYDCYYYCFMFDVYYLMIK